MDFDLTEPEEELVALCEAFAAREISPVAPAAWKEGRCPVELLAKMGELGLLGLLIPEEWGGVGMTTVGFVAAMEKIGAADQSVASAWQAHLTIGSLPLLKFGTDAQKERWLRPLAEGKSLGAFGLTEPEAGSDAAGIRTTAEPRDGGWVVNGSKMFISNAGTAMSGGVVVLARVAGSVDGAARYVNLMVPTGTEGYTQGPKLEGIGWRGLDTRALYFDDVWVPDDHVIGDPDLGLAQFLQVLEAGRISVAALSVSLAKAVLDMSLSYAKERRQFGRPIADFQATKFKLAEMATELEAARWLTYRAAALRDQGRPFRKEAAMAKFKASRTAVAAATEAVQIHGGIGYMLETPVARFYCDAKVLEIGEGTNEIQRMVIARDIGC